MNNELAPYGILGMKWGVRRYRNEDGSLTPAGKEREQRKLKKEATKDAMRYAKAKMAYGEGSGIQRRHVKAELEQKMKDPNYKKTFDDVMEHINYAKATKQATNWRRTRDAKTQLKRSSKALGNALTGTSSLAAAGIIYYKYKSQVDNFVRQNINKIKARL